MEPPLRRTPDRQKTYKGCISTESSTSNKTYKDTDTLSRGCRCGRIGQRATKQDLDDLRRHRIPQLDGGPKLDRCGHTALWVNEKQGKDCLGKRHWRVAAAVVCGVRGYVLVAVAVELGDGRTLPNERGVCVGGG